MIGIVLFALGIALAVAASVVRLRQRTEVRLGQDEITISSAGRTASAPWSDITAVSSDQHAIYLAREKGSLPALKINTPRGSADPQVGRLSAELAGRLDDSRGYRPL